MEDPQGRLGGVLAVAWTRSGCCALLRASTWRRDSERLGGGDRYLEKLEREPLKTKVRVPSCNCLSKTFG